MEGARGDATCSAPFVPFTALCAGAPAGSAIMLPFANVSDTNCAKASRLASPSEEVSGSCRDARSVSIEVDDSATIDINGWIRKRDKRVCGKRSLRMKKMGEEKTRLDYSCSMLN